MSEQVILFLIGQAVLVTGVVGGLFWKLRDRIGQVSGQVGEIHVELRNYAERREESLAAQLALTNQVAGLSRVVERHDTLIEVVQEQQRAQREG